MGGRYCDLGTVILMVKEVDFGRRDRGKGTERKCVGRFAG